MHIFGVPRVHRVLLCIWFPHVMGFLAWQSFCRTVRSMTSLLLCKSAAAVSGYTEFVQSLTHGLLEFSPSQSEHQPQVKCGKIAFFLNFDHTCSLDKTELT